MVSLSTHADIVMNFKTSCCNHKIRGVEAKGSKSMYFGFKVNVKDTYHCKIPETATRVALIKKLFLKISQYLQENTCVGVSLCWPPGLQL